MKRLHLVDLDGARESRVINWRVLEQICVATRLEVDFSGGIKRTRIFVECLMRGPHCLHREYGPAK